MALAMNSFIAKINPTVSENCPFCDKTETLVHCHLSIAIARVLSHILKTVFLKGGEVWSEAAFIFGAGYDKEHLCDYLLIITV